MKRLLVLLAMLVYGASSSGMTIQLHYCCGKLEGVSLSPKQHTDDCEGKDSEMAGCCVNQEIAADMDVDQQLLSYKYFAVPFAVVPVQTFADFTHIPSRNFDPAGFPPSPPGSAIPLYLQYRVFRI